MALALYVPQVSVNDIPIEIIPNSLKWKNGKGERKTRVASGGAGRVTTYNTEDIETQIGEITFRMILTNEAVEQIEEWQDNFDSNTVTFQEKGIERTMNRSIIMNDPENAAGVEGEVEITFSGSPLV